MDLMASVSRSSGLEKDGDDLKNFRIQEEYREFVQGKLDAYRKQFPLEIRTHDKRRIDAQENVLILFRKLREGVFASKRRDGLALEVYETSFYLSVIFNSAKQIAAAMSHLVPDAYQTLTCPKPLCRPTVVLSLLYHLVASYPSQASYHSHISAIPPSLLPRQSGAYSWIQSLASALRARNYSKFSQFYKKQSLAAIFEDSTPPGDKSNTQLVKVAILAILDDLRSKARDTSWAVLRSAYRELDTSADKTSAWLTTSLSLQPLLVTDDRTWTAEGWLNEQSSRGHTRQKEGIQGKWIICKVR
ncbi:hypothetical protein BKA70DRAFT_1422148 [Coprinopsis sp. MPI-PUGE-AT-0042]|nr:hypothetical protein BKA70DRAFT_1422148 [Coprinopsis sp. MPI-PUGE-AT-0042]